MLCRILELQKSFRYARSHSNGFPSPFMWFMYRMCLIIAMIVGAWDVLPSFRFANNHWIVLISGVYYLQILCSFTLSHLPAHLFWIFIHVLLIIVSSDHKFAPLSIVWLRVVHIILISHGLLHLNTFPAIHLCVDIKLHVATCLCYPII